MCPYFLPLRELLYAGQEHRYPKEAWRVYVLCNTESPRSAEVLSQMEEMKAINDRKAARAALEDLDSKSKSGLDMTDLYDANTFHDGFTHKPSGTNMRIKVLRLRKSSIRIYLVYPKGVDKTILILSALSKRKDDLSKKEKSYLSNLVDLTIPYWSNDEFSSRLIHTE